MIAIINKGGPADGVCTYTVGINRDVVTEFQHDRRKGLARCLRDAARAVDKVEYEAKRGAVFGDGLHLMGWVGLK